MRYSVSKHSRVSGLRRSKGFVSGPGPGLGLGLIPILIPILALALVRELVGAGVEEGNHNHNHNHKHRHKHRRRHRSRFFRACSMRVERMRLFCLLVLAWAGETGWMCMVRRV